MEIPRNVVGKPVAGADFFGRESQLGQLRRLVEQGNHVLLTAPRRIGKSSLMMRLAEQLRNEKWIVLRVDAGGIGELQLVTELAGQLHEQRRSVFKAITPAMRAFYERVLEVGLFGVSAKLDQPVPTWEEAGSALLDALGDERCLIMIDEVAVLVLSMLRSPEPHRAEAFLRWLRRVRQRHTNARWLLSGSIGLDTIVKRAGLATPIADLYIYDQLGAFDPGEAHTLLEQLGEAEGMPLAEDVREHMCNRLEWLVPFYLQLLFCVMRERHRDGGPPPTIADVDEAYQRLLKPSREVNFLPWKERLRDQLGPPMDRHASEMLDAVAGADGVAHDQLDHVLAGAGVEQGTRRELLPFLLRVLENDGYVAKAADARYRFRSPLLRDVWRTWLLR